MRLGVLGGTFDPVHMGHLLLAEQTRESLSLDRVLFIPASRPPHKPHRPVAPYDVRLRLVRLALEGIPNLEAGDLERDDSHPSYTVETLRRLRGLYPEPAEVWLLLGADALSELPTWHQPEEILRLARLAVYPRPGRGPEGPPAALPGDLLRLDPIQGPRLALSSSEIRERLAAGRSVRFLVPESVRACIEREGYYRPGPERPAS